MLIVLLAGALAMPTSVARTPSQDPAADAPPVPLLWRACDVDNCLYLLGALHLLKPSDYPLAREVEAAFTDAERLLFEVAPGEMDSPAAQRHMLAAARRADGRTLADELSPALRARLVAWLTKNAAQLERQGMSPAAFGDYRPWFVALVVTTSAMGARGMQPALGLDRHLMHAAARSGKPVAGLETASAQIALLAAMTGAEQRQMLADAFDALADDGAEIRRLHAAWRRGDAGALAALTTDDMRRRHPRLYRAINVDRNDAWMPQLERRLAAPGLDDHLIVVGAMHLLGPDGLVERLRARGYRVERLCSACAAGPSR